MAEQDLDFREELAWVPAAVGFLLGALFVWLGDQFTTDDHLATFGSLFNAKNNNHGHAHGGLPSAAAVPTRGGLSTGSDAFMTLESGQQSAAVRRLSLIHI